MTPSTVSYYTDTVAKGIEDYYSGRGEAEGRWVGDGAAQEGLDCEVAADELQALFAGRHPVSGESLGAAYGVREGADRVTGWDLTFSAPKSVSVLWAVGGGEVGLQVREAHDAAVTAALGYLDEHAAFSRTGKAGVRQVDTYGLVGAAYVHRSSRAGDPQLHTHVLVSGRVRCRDDGVWRALDSRALHRQLKPAGMLYQAALRAELSERLGVEWTEVDRNGQAEVVGVPEELCRLFAQRRPAVEAKARELTDELEAIHGRELTLAERRRVFERAVLLTRDPKGELAETTDGLHDRWWAEADAAGLEPESWIRDTVDRRHALDIPDRQGVVEDVVGELGEGMATWRRADVVRALARHAPQNGTAEVTRAWIEATADAVVAAPEVVCLAAPELAAPAELRRLDGQCVFDRHDAARYTTVATLEAEQHVLDLADAGRDARRAVAELAVVELTVDVHDLGDDQAAAVRAVTGNGDTVSCVVGPAGAGKSRSMRAAADAWRAGGIPVRGLALSAVAAGVLAEEANVPADTVAKFLTDHQRGADGLRPGEVLVVDEAGMVGSRDLARLATLAHHAHGKLVLVGDHAQLSAIDAGGLFAMLADSHGVDLTDVRRFTHDWERDASLRLRARDPAVLAVYEDHRRVVETDRLGVVDLAAQSWLDARARGESLVVCAADRNTVSAICDTVRDHRVAAGDVTADGVVAGGQIVGVGDEIVTCRNDRRIPTTDHRWVRNGDRWQVTAIGDDASLAVSSITGHGRAHLPADYAAEHVQLGYALTIHKAQGVTVDKALVVVDETTTAQALYVGMTRGRHDNTALVCTDSLDLDHHDPPTTAADVFAAALARDASEDAATIALRRTLAASESLASLAPRLANLDAQIHRDIPPDRTIDLERLAARRAHVEQHARPGIVTSARRHDRHHLRLLDEQRVQLDAAIEHRKQWLTEHADLLAYRDELAQQVSERRQKLAELAAETAPPHLVDLLGEVPEDPAVRARWATLAGRVEAYREEWGINPDQLHDRPTDYLQRTQWDAVIPALETSRRLDTITLEHGLDRGIDIGRGIEL